uniref:Uncharacterized protein n=1 Tax=Kryptolebias marmoratus TaxID=37003 RepID=A0A3Q2ZJ60_KRYMA
IFDTLVFGGKSSSDKKKIKKKSWRGFLLLSTNHWLYCFCLRVKERHYTRMSSKAMSVMNSSEASRLAHYNKHPTITSREIQADVHLLLSSELAEPAVPEDTKVITKVINSNLTALLLNEILFFVGFITTVLYHHHERMFDCDFRWMLV